MLFPYFSGVVNGKFQIIFWFQFLKRRENSCEIYSLYLTSFLDWRYRSCCRSTCWQNSSRLREYLEHIASFSIWLEHVVRTILLLYFRSTKRCNPHQNYSQQQQLVFYLLLSLLSSKLLILHLIIYIFFVWRAILIFLHKGVYMWVLFAWKVHILFQRLPTWVLYPSKFVINAEHIYINDCSFIALYLHKMHGNIFIYSILLMMNFFFSWNQFF